MYDRFTFYVLRSTFGREGLHASAATDVAALLDTLEVELQAASFTPSQRAILTADAPRWTMEHTK
jgi:hypothetical protein